MKRRRFFRTVAAAPLAPALLAQQTAPANNNPGAYIAGASRSGSDCPARAIESHADGCGGADSYRDRGSRRSRGHVAEVFQCDTICDTAKA